MSTTETAQRQELAAVMAIALSRSYVKVTKPQGTIAMMIVNASLGIVTLIVVAPVTTNSHIGASLKVSFNKETIFKL